ncbi:MAG: hypothetical protein ACSHXB_08855 [Sulfitobacter sp.]
MFKGNRILSITAGLTLIVAFAVGGYILGFGLGEQSGEHQANTDTYAKHAQDEIKRTCGRLNGAAYTECIIGVVETTNEHKRSESDLTAQRNMARWALWMLLATIAIAIVTAFGVYYVWRTLSVTREIGEAQVRAYLFIDGAKVTPRVEKDHVFWDLNVTFKNSGQSPARNIEAEASLWTPHISVKSIIPDIASSGSVTRGLIVSQIPDDVYFFPESDTKVIFRASIRVRFQDVFETQGRFTEVTAEFFASFDLIGGETHDLSPMGKGAGIAPPIGN